MEKKWLSAFKKFFESEKERYKTNKSTKKRHKSKSSRKTASDIYEDTSPLNKSPLPPSPPLKKAYKDSEKSENQHANTLSATAAGRPAEEILTKSTLGFVDDGSRKEVAAVKIQAALRGYLARKGTVCLRGMLRLKLMINRNAVKRQTVKTLHGMQALARIQSQVRERRNRLSEENQALHRQRQLKREKELQKSKGEDWVDSPKSKEQFEANLQKKQEAALRRERTLAYAYSHQWRNKSTQSKNQPFIDQTNPQWGWSWLERWMATRPWETNPAIFDRSGDLSSLKGAGQGITGGRRSAAKSRQSPSTPRSAASKDDISSLPGSKPDRNRRRRHSFGGSFCFRDEDAVRTKSRFRAPESGESKAVAGGGLSREHLSFSGAVVKKKRMPETVAARRLSAPLKVVSN